MRKKRSAIILKNKELGHFVSKKRLFIKGSKLNERKMLRAQFILRALIGLGLVGVLVAVFIFIFVFFIPYLQSKISNEQEAESSQLSSVVSYEPQASYDQFGLPVLSDEIALKLINWKKTADEKNVPEVQKVSGIEVNKDIALALKTMLAAAKEESYVINLSYGYVSYEEQQTRYNDKVAENQAAGQTLVMAKTDAKKEVPVAGESDFQTGLCVRIEAESSESFKTSQTYAWLDKNMKQYGFVFRFPEGKTTYTGLKEDYTVIRYVGQANAEVMLQLSMCLEEYVSYLNNR